ncbi:MAG: type II toxin-antitoxin system RelE/ParE family toxin [Chromatiaceae bacterium]|jgi:mRNA interferase RelE/StbE|nr:type II toxin-antitoxin system RelE/ParE family toxin [Chromatiaceae bacterium]
MTYRIEVTRSARKILLSLPRDVQKRLAAAIDGLASDPRPAGCRKLTGSDALYRIRVGDYRVVYEPHDDRLLVMVIKLGHRREIYR